MGGSRRRLVRFFAGASVGKFRVKESIPDAFLPSSVYGLILVRTGRDNGIADGGFWRICSISCFKDLIVL